MCDVMAVIISASKWSNCHLLGDSVTPSSEMNSPATTFLILLLLSRPRDRTPLFLCSDAQLAEALHRLARREVVQLEQLAHLDLAFLAVRSRIGIAPGPFHGLFFRLHLNKRVAGDELLRLGEGPVDHGALPSGVLDAPALRARLEPGDIEQHAGFHQLLVVRGHRRDELLLRHDARFRVPAAFDNNHVSHRRASLSGYCFLACARRRASCSRCSGGSAGPKSSTSNPWRISISPSWKGLRLIHSTGSAIDFTRHSQKPATSSFVSVKGPSITVRFVPENLTRTPFELGWSPSPASITPAFTSSSLNFPMSVRIFLSGRMPASECLLALTSTITRIVVPPCGFGVGARLPDGFDRRTPAPTYASNKERRKSTPRANFGTPTSQEVP